MRWFVEVSRVGDSTPAERYCVEAKAWQAALQETRKLRGDSGPLSKFSIELLDDGYRAVDPIQKIRYLVNQAPSDSPLVLPVNGASSISSAPGASASKPPAASVPSAPPVASRGSIPSFAPSVVAATPVTSYAPPAAAAPAAVASVSGMSSSPAGLVAHAASVASGAASSPPIARASAAPLGAGARSGSLGPSPMVSVGKGVDSIVPRPSPARRRPTPLTLDHTPPPPEVAPIGQEPAPIVASPAPIAAVTPVPPGISSATSDSTLPGYRVFMSRAQEPKPEAPITYREQACVVDPGTSREAVEALLRERWLAVKASLKSNPSGQLVQIAVFDHAFQHRPQHPPLGTLAWKDWRGEPVIGFPGFGEAAPPISTSLPPPPPPQVVEAPAPEEATVAPQGVEAPAPEEATAAPQGATPVSPEEEAQPILLQRPAQSSQPDGAVATAPTGRESRPSVSRRRRAGEDLISELFELMHELHFARDIVVGAEFVLGVLAELIPSEYTFVSVFNINTRKFVVVRARGPGAQAAVMHSTADNDPLLADVMRRGGSRAFKTSGDGRFTSGRFSTLKAPLEQLLCGPVKQGGRYLGVVEVGNPLGGKPFHESEINALDYICGQFAEFVASRPVVLDSDVILGR